MLCVQNPQSAGQLFRDQYFAIREKCYRPRGMQRAGNDLHFIRRSRVEWSARLLGKKRLIVSLFGSTAVDWLTLHPRIDRKVAPAMNRIGSLLAVRLSA